MAKIKIGEKEFEFKLTLESWKRLKECDITPGNIQQKINEDMAAVISSIVFYGLTPADRAITQETIDQTIDLSIAKQITALIEESLTGDKTEKK
jgi:hypothetical protein